MAERVTSKWITFYNTDHHYPALERRTPAEVYFDGKELKKSA